ncbi:hypothetical protein ACFL6S_30610 [Candidatus Poribacteria bacterium]
MMKPRQARSLWRFSNIDPEFTGKDGSFTDYYDQKTVRLEVEKAINRMLPLKLYGKGEGGCSVLVLYSSLESGSFQLEVSLKEPSSRIDFVIYLDGRMIATNAVYFDETGSKGQVTHVYDFISTFEGTHEIRLEIPQDRIAEELELSGIALLESDLRTNKPGWEKEEQGRVHIDIWGWHSPLSYSRSHPVDLNYYKERVIDEPWKWGANLLHYWNWAGEEHIHEMLRYVHERDMIYEEHWFPPRFPQDRPVRSYRIGPTMDKMRLWADNVVNAVENGWLGAGDGWIPEETARGKEGASSDSTNVVNTNHTIWLRNPGAFTSVFTNRPNTASSGDCSTTDRYKGPNFIYAVSTQGGRGVDDKFSQRLFFQNMGFKNQYNDLFLFLQAECRPTPHRGPYGGRSDPDWWLKQLCDFLRPRARDPQDLHESGIFWMIENDLGMPDELRDYVYAMSLDPLRTAITTRLSSTGMGGAIWNIIEVARQSNSLSQEYVGNSPRSLYPASTSFIQNNYFRLYRFALGDKGVLVYDTENLAHFDSDSLSLSLSEGFLKTVPRTERSSLELFFVSRTGSTSSEAPDVIGLNGSAEMEINFASDTGTYPLCIEQPATDRSSVVKVTVDGLECGIYTAENIARKHEIPLFVHGHRTHTVKLELLQGEGHPIESVEILDTSLLAKTVKKYGQWNDSHEELQHRVTKGIGGYEYGEWLYPTCYLDLDDLLPQEFPAGIGYGFPQPLNLDLTLPKGAYLLVVGGQARLAAGSLISVALNPNAAMLKSPDFVPPEWQRYAGEYEIPGDQKWHRRVIPLNLYRSGKNRIQIAHSMNGREGHWFDALELIEAPIRHNYVEYGGHKAVMEEELTIQGEDALITEKRRYEMYSDTPYFTIQMERSIAGNAIDLDTVINCEGYDMLLTNGRTFSEPEAAIETPRTIVLRDTAGFRPDLMLTLLEQGDVGTIGWKPERELILHSTDVKQENIRLGVAVASPEQGLNTSVLEDLLSNEEMVVLLPEEGTSLEIANPLPISAIKILKIANPSEGPYFVKEKGWWRVRGGQISCEQEGIDLLKVYCPARGSAQVQRYGYILNTVKPGYGCQYTVQIGDVESSEGRASCKAKVTNVTPALFAPRVRFKGEIASARVNGKPWHYYDEKGLVFLPNRPGEYRIEVSYGTGDEKLPRLTRTGASVARCVYIAETRTLVFDAELPPWVRKLPEDQYYMGLIAYDKQKQEIANIEGGKVEKKGTRGDIVAFKPGTVTITFRDR